jgi:hypothetical protein
VKIVTGGAEDISAPVDQPLAVLEQAQLLGGVRWWRDCRCRSRSGPPGEVAVGGEQAVAEVGFGGRAQSPATAPLDASRSISRSSRWVA